ncbi:MAG TPA: hypothetical protein VMJ64_06235, partial [Anaerolineales bacterium]|nr:hypothetical protein [Anaerolineales bacterium]
WSNATIIPMNSLSLYYITYRSEGGLERILAPIGSAGYTDEFPKIPDEHELAVVIIFWDYFDKNNMTKGVTLEQAWKLKIIVISDDGSNDAARTYKLYRTIYRTIASIPPDDDSWMYRSRPIIW